MPETFNVLRCFQCLTFQAHAVKKADAKWQCKICFAKQSLKKIYGNGSGFDCRKHVQKLNSRRRQMDSCQEDSLMTDIEQEEDPEHSAEADAEIEETSSDGNNRKPKNQLQFKRHFEEDDLKNRPEMKEKVFKAATPDFRSSNDEDISGTAQATSKWTKYM